MSNASTKIICSKLFGDVKTFPLVHVGTNMIYELEILPIFSKCDDLAGDDKRNSLFRGIGRFDRVIMCLTSAFGNKEIQVIVILLYFDNLGMVDYFFNSTGSIF